MLINNDVCRCVLFISVGDNTNREQIANDEVFRKAGIRSEREEGMRHRGTEAQRHKGGEGRRSTNDE